MNISKNTSQTELIKKEVFEERLPMKQGSSSFFIKELFSKEIEGLNKVQRQIIQMCHLVKCSISHNEFRKMDKLNYVVVFILYDQSNGELSTLLNNEAYLDID